MLLYKTVVTLDTSQIRCGGIYYIRFKNDAVDISDGLKSNPHIVVCGDVTKDYATFIPITYVPITKVSEISDPTTEKPFTIDSSNVSNVDKIIEATCYSGPGYSLGDWDVNIRVSNIDR
jgi:hypothetical protein